MPLPKPRPGEARQGFLNRCMDNETMKSEYPGEQQRFAVCQSQWESVPQSAVSETATGVVTLEISDVEHDSTKKFK